MRIAITGASGFVGSRLVERLRERGDEPVALVRVRTEGAAPTGSVRWDTETGELDRDALGAIDGVVHLAGENIAAGRWTTARKERIRDSRGPVTEALCQTLADLTDRPRALVSASATGIYGDRGDEVLHEGSSLGDGFLADVAAAWEAGTASAREAGIRVVNLRIGIVLHPSGGALGKMLLPFKLGVGGRLGSGKQWMSWITREDLVSAILFALDRDELAGPVHAVAPEPVTNLQFTKTLGRVLGRPTVLPVPAFALRLLFGEMADAALLASQRAEPRALQTENFEFAHADLESALRAVLDR